MTAANGWVAEAYAQINAPHVRTALAALSLTGDAMARGGAFAEIGCGTGEIARTAAERGFEVWASDASPSMVDATCRTCAGLSVHAEVCPAEKLDLPWDRFTVAHSSWVPHWLSEVDDLLRRMARALRPGVHLVLQWTGAQPRGDGAGKRRRYKLAGFADQAAALGERADEFVDEVLGGHDRGGSARSPPRQDRHRRPA
ncbi:class I SAM-dependent methyltransferase [Streptomyces sp. NPDC059850]|uniref:class I SAM-dependent methyltransferase n=1 Tax=Streptomyces sp. NPDC059850 TaxID=3346970 RepID=UPI00364CF94B